MRDTAVCLTKSQIGSLIEFIEYYFIDSIRTDAEIDNIDYIVDMMDVLVKLRNARADMKFKEEDNDSQAKCR